MHLDDTTPASITVPFGTLGTHGDLGYHGLTACVQGQSYIHSLSAHPPCTIRYNLGGKYEQFRAACALNDSSDHGLSATFHVYADGVLVAVAANISVASGPRNVEANIRGAQFIELRVLTEVTEHCHAVWLNPRVLLNPISEIEGCMGGFTIRVPEDPVKAERCIVTVVTPSYIEMTENFLETLHKNGNVNDAVLLIFAFGMRKDDRKRLERFNPIWVDCYSDKSNILLKTAAYSAPHVVLSDKYLVIDGDMLVINDISQAFEVLDTLASDKIVVCREQGMPGRWNLGYVLFSGERPYFSDPGDHNILRITQDEANYRLIINGGIISGTREAWLGVENTMRAMMPESAHWEGKKEGESWREQAILNLALARLDCGVEMDPCYNVQMLSAKVKDQLINDATTHTFCGRPARILHFNGIPGKAQYAEYANIYGNSTIALGGGFINFDFDDELQGFIEEYGYDHAEVLENRMYFDRLREIADELHADKVLVADDSSGLAPACLTDHPCRHITALNEQKVLPKNTMYDCLPMDRLERIKLSNCDVLSEMKSMVDNDTFDLIVLRSTGIEKHVYAQFLLAVRLLERGGKIVILENANGKCRMKNLIKRIEYAGHNIIDELSSSGLCVVDPRK